MIEATEATDKLLRHSSWPLEPKLTNLCSGWCGDQRGFSQAKTQRRRCDSEHKRRVPKCSSKQEHERASLSRLLFTPHALSTHAPESPFAAIAMLRRRVPSPLEPLHRTPRPPCPARPGRSILDRLTGVAVVDFDRSIECTTKCRSPQHHAAHHLTSPSFAYIPHNNKPTGARAHLGRSQPRGGRVEADRWDQRTD